jgi:hypothetical protein
MDAAKDITATFTLNTYALTTHTDGTGTGTITTNTSGPYACGTVVEVTANPGACSTFTGWAGDLTGSTNPTTITMDAAKDITATFDPITYQLTTAVTGTGSASGDDFYNCGAYADIIATETDACWVFDQWTGSGITDVNDPTTTVLMDASKSVTAVFTQLTYTLSVTANDSDGGTPSFDGSSPFNCGADASIHANTNSGWVFDGWTPSSGIANASAEDTTVSMTQNRALTANYHENAVATYVLTMATAGGNGGTATDLTGGSPYAAGTVVSISATANNGSAHYNWTAPAGTFGDADDAATTFTMPAQDVTVTANFVVPQWVFYTTYPSQTDSYWKFYWILREYLTPGSGAGYSTGGWCDKNQANIYSDSTCLTPMNPTRVVGSAFGDQTIQIYSPMYDWRGITDFAQRQRWSQASSPLGTVTNTLYYRLHTAGFGAPFVLSESWTYTEQIDSSINLGDKTTNGITATVGAATEVVTLTVNGASTSFTCYKITINQGGLYIYEWWDADGLVPYTPIKIVDSVNFKSTQTQVLYSTTLNLNP